MRNNNWFAVLSPPGNVLYEETLLARKFRCIGSLPSSFALGSCDIGEAELDNGEIVVTTWGRNLDRDLVVFLHKKTQYKSVWCGTSDGSCELIIPDNDAAKLRSILM